jgi:hypothetical protein
MISAYNLRLVDETMRELGVKKQILFTRASVTMYPRMKAANALRRGRQAYLDYGKTGLYPDFVVKFCEKVLQQSRHSNVVNLAARRGGAMELNTRRPAKPTH